jgi:hypothetical protein
MLNTLKHSPSLKFQIFFDNRHAQTIGGNVKGQDAIAVQGFEHNPSFCQKHFSHTTPVNIGRFGWRAPGKPG